jgi:hypothetical protein
MPIASCHCGAVTLEIARRPRQLTACNCSICRRYGALWAYYRRGSVAVRCSPTDAVAGYSRRETGALTFKHCRICGCVMFHERRRDAGDDTRLGVNARMMEPDDIAGLRIRRLDGASSWRYLD